MPFAGAPFSPLCLPVLALLPAALFQVLPPRMMTSPIPLSCAQGELGGWRGTDKNEPYLAQVQRDVDLIVLQATGQGWALPPALGAIDRVAHWVCLVAVGSCTDVTVLALQGEDGQVTKKG